jgi:hypothetical protein
LDKFIVIERDISKFAGLNDRHHSTLVDLDDLARDDDRVRGGG